MTDVAYTLGYAAGYDAALFESQTKPFRGPPQKLGYRADYGGGWVWKTSQEAFEFLFSDGFAKAFPDREPAEFAVYTLLLPHRWDRDTSGPEDDGVHRLVNDARILGRCDDGGYVVN